MTRSTLIFRATALALLAWVSGRAGVPAGLHLPELPAESRYAVEPAFPDLPRVLASAIVAPPGETNRLFLLSKSGMIYAITNLAAPNLTTVLDLSSKTFDYSESGLVGFALHPGWRTNREAYVFYATQVPRADNGVTSLHQRLSRFLLDPDDPNRLLPDTETPLITQQDNDENHNGGDLVFRQDGYLYVSLGDGGSGYDSFNNAQKIDGGFFSGILRLDVDLRPGNLPPNPHPAVHAGTYLVPADNPFVGATSFAGNAVNPETLRTEFYAAGLRNPFRLLVDVQTDDLYANDVGGGRREEINRIQAGGNYGWLVYEGTLTWPYSIPAGVPYLPPLVEYEHQQGRIAITGGALIRGDAFPDLKDRYLFSDLGGDIGTFSVTGDQAGPIQWIANSPGTSDIAWIPESGAIYLANVTDGIVRRLLLRNREGPPIPPRLSETGIFEDLASLRPVASLTEYQVNVPFWSDYAEKRRWFGMPDTGGQIVFSKQGPWGFPLGSTWVKHFELELERGRPETRKRIETRVIVRNSDGVWGATYRWNAAGTDAELIPAEGLEEDLTVVEAGQQRTQRWHYPSRAECLLCHNASGGPVLGFSTAQLNLETDLPDGTRENQLAALIARGLFANPPDGVATLPALAALDDTRWSLEYRIKSYLAANCAYCHLPGGPTRARWNASLETPLSQARIMDERSLINVVDNLGSVDSFIVKPGSLHQSAMYRRVAESGLHHMPPIATSELNPEAILALKDWIVQETPGRLTLSQWQIREFGTNAPVELAGADADPDGDGLTNEGEFLLGESPTEPTRRWRAVIGSSGDRVVLTYPRLANRRFEVQWSPNLVGAPWRPLEHPDNRWFVGSVEAQVELSLPVESAPAFYQVEISEP
ncbi:MAG: PQQ-dependent sugar dehydrogenase [Verrucomicrobiae bacterium]|nr:PQQ-dependent sugar dehydrogenase [Verrucomicrobiae bacterium]